MLKISLPADLKETGNRISRALDSDVGGYHVFDYCYDETTNTVYTTIQESDSYAQKLLELKDDLDAFSKFIKDSYDERWPEHTAPYKTTCQKFLENIIIEEVV